MIFLTCEQVWARRLARHSLDRRAPAGELVDVAGDVCGIHAQMMSAAELSLGIRVEGVAARDVRAALWDRRQLVKTYGIRGTVHLFPASELPLWMSALRARLPFEMPRLANQGLGDGRLEIIVEAIRNALDGQQLTVRQLGDAVVEQAGAWAGAESEPAFGGTLPLWRRALGVAAMAGAFCFGPNIGSAVTFVRPDQWLGSWSEMDPQTALREVLRRYLRAYGPAAPRDFAQWFGIPKPLANETAAALGDDLQDVDVEGYVCLQLADESRLDVAMEHESVRLLPHFDCYLVGCHPRSQLVPPPWADRVLVKGGAGPVPVLLINGIVAGVWAYQRRGRRVEVAVDPLAALSDRQHELLASEVAHLGEVLEAEAILTVGPITVRPHL